MVTRDHRQAARRDNVVPSAPAREDGRAGLCRPCRHDDRQRRADRERGIPATYGMDDLPIVLQDKRFGRNGEVVYQPDMMDIMHGFQGDTLIVNGVVGPVASVPAGFVRLRLLNAANARNFDLRFTDRRPFFVIASDGGYLSQPVEVGAW